MTVGGFVGMGDGGFGAGVGGVGFGGVGFGAGVGGGVGVGAMLTLPPVTAALNCTGVHFAASFR